MIETKSKEEHKKKKKTRCDSPLSANMPLAPFGAQVTLLKNGKCGVNYRPVRKSKTARKLETAKDYGGCSRR